ncbi:hypothetical protein FDT66_10480 [Polaribacter aestuariivivens]|uniref:TonB-dependent receptor plug domain-containing protein n=1 Tax=Polaribacter aestuariivivens TaxID=2304626 RepID=A0A5S3N396_9FLAO|nr:TonB-dependent receptor plug domain-containing protein [Polaribacter aestuariivivens]TMM29537.1 hypothetical protein FDT66_10480 [Polaribacter aestuariivivens]
MNLVVMKIFKKIISVLVLFFYLGVSSQEKIDLTVVVKDDTNKPIPGAVILIDDIKQKRVANSKGIFKIKLKKRPNEIAAFSVLHGIKKVKYVGQKNIYMIVGGDKDVKLDIVPSNSNQVGGGAQQFRNIYDYLRGKVAGVNIDTNNRISIRGAGSINGNTQPLLVLNGVQVNETTFGDIVPTTIKSIKILKGPETAVYGIRGANGVIEVKTAL